MRCCIHVYHIFVFKNTVETGATTGLSEPVCMSTLSFISAVTVISLETGATTGLSEPVCMSTLSFINAVTVISVEPVVLTELPARCLMIPHLRSLSEVVVIENSRVCQSGQCM